MVHVLDTAAPEPKMLPQYCWPFRTTNHQSIFINYLFFKDQMWQIDNKSTKMEHRAFGLVSIFMTLYSLLSWGICTIPMDRLMCRESLASHSSSYQVPWSTQETSQNQECSVQTIKIKPLTTTLDRKRYVPFSKFPSKPTAFDSTPWGLSKARLRAVNPDNPSFKGLTK